ncbi:MAG: hypothetical protein OHK0023_02560 [Anaerolineae bacterium]
MDEIFFSLDSSFRALIAQGWQVTTQDQMWRLQKGEVALFAGFNAHWVYLTAPVTAQESIEDYLRRCDGLYMVKYALDADGALILQVDLPLFELERAYLHFAVQALARAVSEHGISRARISSISAVAETELEYFPRHTLDTYFKALKHIGWGYRKPLGLNDYHLHYKAPERPFEVYLSFNSAWAYWQIPLLDRTQLAQSGKRAALYRYLLKANEQLYWAKFALDGENQVVLALEIPLSLFTLERFRQAGQTLGTYAAEYAYEVAIMADVERDESLAALLASV